MNCTPKPYTGFAYLKSSYTTFPMKVFFIFNVEAKVVFSSSQINEACFARYVLFYKMNKAGKTHKEISKEFNRARETITNGIAKMQELYNYNPSFRNKCKLLGIEI